jgi:hypothetical protein
LAIDQDYIHAFLVKLTDDAGADHFLVDGAAILPAGQESILLEQLGFCLPQAGLLV